MAKVWVRRMSTTGVARSRTERTLRESKVGQDDMASFGDENVLGFEVPAEASEWGARHGRGVQGAYL